MSFVNWKLKIKSYKNLKLKNQKDCNKLQWK